MRASRASVAGWGSDLGGKRSIVFWTMLKSPSIISGFGSWLETHHVLRVAQKAAFSVMLPVGA